MGNEELRRLPSVDEVLRSDGMRPLLGRFPRQVVTGAVRTALDARRRRLRDGQVIASPAPGTREIEQVIAQSRQSTLRRAINATGVVLHTNLGRAPLPAAARAAVTDIAAGYSTLEYAPERRERSSRQVHAEELLIELTGGPASLVVNNNAGAVLVALAALASGREVIVSRGELVEIGGGFRIPDVLRASGARLREVGTTNKTRPADYTDAISSDTALLLKVHRSNFAVLGFTEEVDLEVLAAIGKTHDLPVLMDLGSGALVDPTALGLPGDEPTVGSALRRGADVVAFSGDKLLGGPQAGILVGRSALIDRIRVHPLVRALRPDKLTLAALGATLAIYREGTELEQIPTLRMLAEPLERIGRRMEALLEKIRGLAGLSADGLQLRSKVGGGALPLVELDTWAVAVRATAMDPDALAGALAAGHPSVVTRVKDDAVVFDLRTVADDELDTIVTALAEALGSDATNGGEPPLIGAARIVIGTAGHVDHGKTSLVRALTGIDTDRLPEEKKRGISIELGFARLALDGGRTAAVIDVPGHERFVRTMVAGATGIDLALFVIAADEGIMPQTREHLDICSLLGVQRGIIALTKIDRVDADLRRLAVDEVRTAIRGTFLEQAPLIPCSVATGEGLDPLRAALARAVAESPTRAADGICRLPIDRVFSVQGFGTVVTGTLVGGRLAAGMGVELLPSGLTGKARGLEVHGESRQQAEAGERVAVNLHGIACDQISRGDVLAPEGAAVASTVVEVELTVLPLCPTPVGPSSRVLFHALTAHEDAQALVMGGTALAPGATGFAQIHLPRALALLPNDRFVLRGFRALAGYGSTIAGGRVLRVAARPLRRPSREPPDRLRRFSKASPEERVALELEAAGPAGLTVQQLGARTGEAAKLVEQATHRLLSRRFAHTLDRDTGRIVSAGALEKPKQRILEALDRFHQRQPLLPGMGREELRTSARATVLDSRAFAAALAELEREGAIDADHQNVRRKGFSSIAAESGKEALMGRLLAALVAQGLGPASPAILADTLQASLLDTQSALEILVRRGELVRLKEDLFFHHQALARLRLSLGEFLAANGQITSQDFKRLTEQSRKYTIPLAEYFDAEKFTLRVGEVRRLRR